MEEVNRNDLPESENFRVRFEQDRERTEALFEVVQNDNITIGEALLLSVFLLRLTAMILNQERIFNIFSKAVYDTYVDIAKSESNSVLSFSMGVAKKDGIQHGIRINQKDGELSPSDSKERQENDSIQNESSESNSPSSTPSIRSE